ncbi:TMEM165/GDT1 family protein [Microcella frigidaquae]|uniref:Putative Ca2+/H+ antiporter (TMEM165/GDT1 family) n=1 Tax=Microcella frigidaquae TaxID=424758 RepID=A0A840XF05_9MICO|nr:TMEM165/GDT1 family protein [Microcella frigidaquae]MBB5617082.1 putative Ca2+/H+ antiporter (TMEM165/GDT1 family) [Microcella frigidaquae]NHN45286.1 TMEM165/GDT1 family protein [Microcella frigidaquae]
MQTTLMTLILAAEETEPLIAPPLVIAGSMAGIFILLALATWSYRDVANRHSHKVKKTASHDAGH